MTLTKILILCIVIYLIFIGNNYIVDIKREAYSSGGYERGVQYDESILVIGNHTLNSSEKFTLRQLREIEILDNGTTYCVRISDI